MDAQHYGTGRRKTSTARVFLRPGTGKFNIDDRDLEKRFPTASLRIIITEPLVVTESLDKFDIFATTSGGGVSGQAGALSLGIARALGEADPALRGTLKSAGMLTRDPRGKDRKKYGLAGARKRFQFSKR